MHDAISKFLCYPAAYDALGWVVVGAVETGQGSGLPMFLRFITHTHTYTCIRCKMALS